MDIETISTFSETVWTNATSSAIMCVIYLIGVYFIGLIIQGIISGIALDKRKGILKEEYGYNDTQIGGFYLKSVLLFPVTWSIFVIRGTKATWGAIKGFFINLWILIKRIAEN